MRYSKVVRTRLSPEQARGVRKYAQENATHDASVIRLAVKKFLEAQEAKQKQEGDNNATAK